MIKVCPTFILWAGWVTVGSLRNYDGNGDENVT